MTPMLSNQEHDPNDSRRRRLFALSACALLLLLLAPTLRYSSLLGARSNDEPAIAGDVADGPNDDLRDGASAISHPTHGLSSGWSKRSHDSIAGALDARAEAIVTGESFDEWVALQPFRQTSADDHENTEESSANGQTASLFGPSFLSGPSFAERSRVFGNADFSDFSLGSGFGSRGVSTSDNGASSTDTLRRARRLIVDSTRGNGDVSTTANGNSSANGGDSGTAGNGGGGNTAVGNGGGVGFVPGGDLTGDPTDPNVSLVVTDPSSDASGFTGGGSLPTNNAPDLPSVPEPTGLVLLGSGLVVAAHSLRARSARRPKQRLATR